MKSVQRVELTGAHSKLARGALGTVYGLDSYSLPTFDGRVVYKEFHEPLGNPADVDSLRMLIAIRLELPPHRRQLLDEYFAWPLREVQDETGRTVGLLMPRLPERYRLTIERGSYVMQKDSQLDYLFESTVKCRSIGVASSPADADLECRLELCRSMATGFALLHELGLVYGDFSHRNALWSTQPQPHVFFIDCDAVRQVTDRTRRQSNTFSWHPPEGGEEVQTESTDCYKLALFILRCLAPGGRGPQKFAVAELGDVLGDEGRELLARGLAPVAEHRTSAAQWQDYLAQYRRDLTSPPAFDSCSVDVLAVPAGEPVTLSWHARRADRVIITWPGGERLTVTGRSGPQTAVRPVSVGGRVSIRLENRHGSCERTLPEIRVLQLPTIDRVGLPFPEIPWVDLREWEDLRETFLELVPGPEWDIALPELRKPGDVVSLPAVPRLLPRPEIRSARSAIDHSKVRVDLPVARIELPRFVFRPVSRPPARPRWRSKLRRAFNRLASSRTSRPNRPLRGSR
jgi:hypothetical protein